MYRIEDADILVTGGAGFIGSTLVQQLIDADNAVTVLDNFAGGSIHNLHDALDTQSSLPERLEVIDENIMEADIQRILRERDVDYVFHLAAEPFVPDSYTHPLNTLWVNAEGTLKTLLACRDSGIERFVQYSSSEIYGRTSDASIGEDAAPRPCSSYAVTKLAADRLCSTVRDEHGVPVTVVRQFNTYGPRETHPRVIPEIIGQLSTGSELMLGNLDARRDFTYVTDATRAAIQLAACPDAEGEIVNVGYGESLSVRELVERISEIMGVETEIETDDTRMRPKDIPKLECDYSKAAELIGYEPDNSIEEGLKKTIAWYQDRGGWLWERDRDVA